MAGVKGRSGRKSTTDEEKRLKIIDKAWEIIYEQLCDVNVPKKEKVEIACKLVVKNMPTSLEHSGEVSFTKMGDILIHTEQGNRVKEYDVGN